MEEIGVGSNETIRRDSIGGKEGGALRGVSIITGESIAQKSRPGEKWRRKLFLKSGEGVMGLRAFKQSKWKDLTGRGLPEEMQKVAWGQGRGSRF